jgi:DNA-3-methyladenine glycosylase
MMTASDFDLPVLDLAPGLIGATLVVHGVGGVIVETEAYRSDDAASHSRSGPTARNASMFAGPGVAYVYRSYGIHWCLNLVGPYGTGVLIRALEPTVGIDRMVERRGTSDLRRLCSGPGRIGQALAITRAQDGLALDRPPFEVLAPTQRPAVVAGPRIGISKAVDEPWRFGLEGSPFLSKPFR